MPRAPPAGSRALGIGEDDSVALMLRNDFATFEANMAAGQLGAYAVPINWHFTAEEAGYILAGLPRQGAGDPCRPAAAGRGRRARRAPRCWSCRRPTRSAMPMACRRTSALGVRQASRLWDAFVARSAPNTAPPKASRGSMIYTSGTTGRPKGVRASPRRPSSRPRRAAEIGKHWGLVADPSIVVMMNGPMYHSAPAAYGMQSARLGLNVVLQPRFEAEDMLRLIDKHRVSHMHIVPTMFVRLLRLPDEVKAKYDLSSLRWITHGAAPCAPAVKRQMIEWWGPVINEYYGATETGIVVWHDSAEALKKPGTVGHVVEGATMRIVDEQGRDVKQGEIGEIYLRGPLYSDFTYNNDDAKRREIALGDLVTVGDIGYQDADGYLYLCDRKRDMIISGGVNIYPAEIESVLIQMPGVRDCAVFGIPDEEFGEQICAHVEPLAGVAVDAGAVRAYLGQHLARYKVPEGGRAQRQPAARGLRARSSSASSAPHIGRRRVAASEAFPWRTDDVTLSGKLKDKLIDSKQKWAADGRLLTGNTAPRDGERLPPGQRRVETWPVLDLGIQPEIPLHAWRLFVDGEVEKPATLKWDEFTDLPKVTLTTDIHCVTAWSRYDNVWEGVSARTLIDLVKPKADVQHVIFHSYDTYKTNVPLADFAATTCCWPGAGTASRSAGNMAGRFA